MSEERHFTRRAGLALIASGAAIAIPQTRGFSSTVADRLTTAGTATDPNALLGIQGIGAAPHDEITVLNNAGYPMEVQITTSAFQLENVGGPYQATVSLPVGGSQTIDFLPETSNADDVVFSAEIFDGGGGTTTVDLSRSISIPVEAGTTYRIRSVYSGMFVTGDPPGGIFTGGAVYQDTWDGANDQRWTLVSDGGSLRFRKEGTYQDLSITGSQGDTDRDVVTAYGFFGDIQRWDVTENPDGSYRIDADTSGTVGDVAEVASTSPGGNVAASPWDGPGQATPNQFWVFDPV